MGRWTDRLPEERAAETQKHKHTGTHDKKFISSPSIVLTQHEQSCFLSPKNKSHRGLPGNNNSNKQEQQEWLLGENRTILGLATSSTVKCLNVNTIMSFTGTSI